MNCIDNISQEILATTRQIDDIISEKFSSTTDLYVSPFIEELLLESELVYVDFKSKVPKIFLNPYDVYITSILGLSLIRGIRTKFECYNLARRLFKVKKLQKQKSHAKIYHEMLGTFITFGKVEEVDFSGNALLLSLLRYYNNMRAKPFIYFEDRYEYKQRMKWHWNYLLPTPLSFLSIKTVEGNYGITPTNFIMMIDLSRKKLVEKTVLGENLRGASTIGYVLAVNPNDYQVKYFGPFPVFIPDIKLTETTILDLEDIVFGYFKGLLVFYNPEQPVITNNLHKNTGEIILFSSWPFSLDIYLLSTMGTIQEDTYTTPFGKVVIPKVMVETKRTKTLANNINNAQIRFNRNIATKKGVKLVDIITWEKILISLINETGFIKKTQDQIYTYEPTFYLYTILSGANPEEIEQELRNISNKGTLSREFIDILRNISTYRKVYRTEKLIFNETVRLQKKHDLWQVI